MVADTARGRVPLFYNPYRAFCILCEGFPAFDNRGIRQESPQPRQALSTS